jgi:hypothetical protein
LVVAIKDLEFIRPEENSAVSTVSGQWGKGGLPLEMELHIVVLAD